MYKHMTDKELEEELNKLNFNVLDKEDIINVINDIRENKLNKNDNCNADIV